MVACIRPVSPRTCLIFLFNEKAFWINLGGVVVVAVVRSHTAMRYYTQYAFDL